MSAAPAILAALAESEALSDEVTRLRFALQNIATTARGMSTAAERATSTTNAVGFDYLSLLATAALEQP